MDSINNQEEVMRSFIINQQTNEIVNVIVLNPEAKDNSATAWTPPEGFLWVEANGQVIGQIYDVGYQPAVFSVT
jgi:hypothetical protein